MAFAIVLAILTLVAGYGAARPNDLWFQHYAGRFARARAARAGEPEHARRRLTYLVVAAICGVLLAVSAWALWQSGQPTPPS